MGIRARLFAAFFAIACFGSMLLRAENPVKEKQDRFSLAVECIKRFEGWHGEKRHWPYVGYGHNYPNLNIILTFWCKYLKYNI